HQREANAERRSVLADDVDADNFRLFAPIERERRRGKRLVRRHDEGTIALVEPLRLNAELSLARLAALKAHAEHLHGVRQLLFLFSRDRLMERVARRSGAKMRQAGTGDEEMCGIGMIDGRKNTASLEQSGRISLALVARCFNNLCDRRLAAD